jgi:integrase
LPAKALTSAAVERFKPGRERREIPDAKSTGLYLIIQPTGAKSWAMRFRKPNGDKAKLTLGPVDFSGRELDGEPVIGMPLTISMARSLAADIHRQRKMGRDVIADHKADKHRRRIETEQAAGSTFGVLVRKFIADHAQPKVRRWREVAAMLGLRYLLDGGEPVEAQGGLAQRWAERDVRSFDGHDIHQAVDEAKRHGVPGRGRRNKGASDPRGRSMSRALSKLFAWLLQERKIASNPCVGVKCPPPPKPRERVLSPNEVRWFWRACDAVGYPYGPLCKILLLTGTRREEARGMRRAEMSEDDDGVLWSLSGARTKNRKPHTVPLSPLACEIIAAAPRIESEQGFVFTTGRTPVGGFSKYKERLDAAMLRAARAEAEAAGRDPSKVTIEPWRVHDLRRTCASGLQKLGVRVEVIERCLGHVSGSSQASPGFISATPCSKSGARRWSAGAFTSRVSSRASRPRSSRCRARVCDDGSARTIPSPRRTVSAVVSADAALH